MKRIIKTLLFIGAFIASTQSLFAQFSLFSNTAVPRVNNPLPFKKGINISTWFEPYEPCKSGVTYFGKQDFANIKNMGADVIRVPIHFDAWASESPDYTIDPFLFELLDEVVQWAQDFQIYVILDAHNDGKSPHPQDLELFLSRIWGQVSNRYRGASKYILYEIFNEPHDISFEEWGKIQGNVIKIIRQHDINHSIIVGGAEHNSIYGMLQLPEYNEYNIIYNFHDYDPFLFTHQGAPFSKAPHAQRIPFPYDEKRMPFTPDSATDFEKNLYETYKKDSNEYEITTSIDRAIAFANARRAPLICTEFGSVIGTSDPKDRVNWYKAMSSFLDSRYIARIAWSYTGDYGIFKPMTENIFPKDLNTLLVKALGFDVPTYMIPTWLDDCNRTGKYVIYKDRFAQKIKVSLSLPYNGEGADLFKRDPKNGERCIDFPVLDPYSLMKLNFSKPIDLTQLYAKGAKLEFYAKTLEPNTKLQIWFENSGTIDLKWRATAFMISQVCPPDGLWHKVSIPLADFIDNGCFDEIKKTWTRSQGKFLWSDIVLLEFQNDNHKVWNGLSIKDIEIVVPEK